MHLGSILLGEKTGKITTRGYRSLQELYESRENGVGQTACWPQVKSRRKIVEWDAWGLKSQHSQNAFSCALAQIWEHLRDKEV